MKMMKKAAIWMLTASMAAGLTACGGSGAEAEDTGDISDPESVKGTITVGGWSSGDDAFKAALEGFHKEYPNVEVKFQFTDTTAHHQALQTALSAGSGAPDVAMIEGAYVAQYRDSAALTNLKEKPYNADELKDDFVEFKWDQCISADGNAVRAIPWDVGPCSYFYRTDIFEECGLPTDPKEVAELMSTWDGVLEVARKVYIPGERWLLPDASYLYFELFCNRDYYDEDLNLKIEREGDLDCLNAVIKMREEKLDMNVDMWGTEATAAFGDGTLASVCTGSWFGGFLKTDYAPDASGKWGVTTMPGGVKASNWGGSFLVIPEQSKNKTAAWAFVKYMLATLRCGVHHSRGDGFQFICQFHPQFFCLLAAEIRVFLTVNVCIIIGRFVCREIVHCLKHFILCLCGCIYSSVNAGLEKGLGAEEIRDLVKSDIEKATAEVKEQQIQTLKDAGAWDK